MHSLFVGPLLEVIGQHQDSGFFVVGLPGMEETVGGGKRADIVAIDRGIDEAAWLARKEEPPARRGEAGKGHRYGSGARQNSWDVPFY